MNLNVGLQPVASVALAFSDSCSHDLFHFSKLTFFWPLISVSFFHTLFYIPPGFLSISCWSSFISVSYTVILIPPALAVFVTLGRWTFLLLGEESAVTCCPSYFMPHCDWDPVLSYE